MSGRATLRVAPLYQVDAGRGREFRALCAGLPRHVARWFQGCRARRPGTAPNRFALYYRVSSRMVAKCR